MYSMVRRDASRAVALREQDTDDYGYSGPETFLNASQPPLPRRARTRDVALASGVGGLVEGVGTSWLRVVTIERQLAPNPPPLLQHMQQLGVKTFARGMGVYTASTVLGDLWSFTVQRLVQQRLHPEAEGAPPGVAALAGAVAGVSEAVLSTPVRALMVAMAAPHHQGQSPAQVAGTLLQEQGPGAFTRGTAAGALRSAVGGALFFPLVSALRGGAEHRSAARDLAAGALAGAVTAAMITPLDVLGAAAQSHTGARTSLLATAQGLWQQGGVAPFYSGIAPSAARAALATGLSYVTTLQVLTMLEGLESIANAR